jgi:hypothetical protein
MRRYHAWSQLDLFSRPDSPSLAILLISAQQGEYRAGRRGADRQTSAGIDQAKWHGDTWRQPASATTRRRQAGLDRIERELRGVYQSLGLPANWKLQRYDVGHAEPPEVRRDIPAFLHERL